MYWKVGMRMSDKARLILPNGKILSARKFAKKWPAFAAEMDGTSAECTLSWYYKQEDDLYVFKDPESEDEIAEILGVTPDISLLELDDSSGSQKSLTSDEITDFKAMLSDVRTALVTHYGKSSSTE